MFRECLRNNIMPFIVLDNDKPFYMRGLKNYKNDKKISNLHTKSINVIQIKNLKTHKHEIPTLYIIF